MDTLKLVHLGSCRVSRQEGRLARPPGRGREFKASSHDSSTRRSIQRSLGGGGAVLRGGRDGVGCGDEGKFLASTHFHDLRQPIHFTHQQIEKM